MRSDAYHARVECELQRDVDHAADRLLDKGIRPTLSMIKGRVQAPRHRLLAALEDWARRLGARMEAKDSNLKLQALAADAIGRVPRERHVESRTKATLAAGQEAAALKEAKRRQTQRVELVKEIEKARSALARFEERKQLGDEAAPLVESISKARRRIDQMETALSAMGGDAI